MVPTVVSELTVPTSNNIAITPIIPTDPLFPPCLQPQRPYHLGEDITEVRRGMHLSGYKIRMMTTIGSPVEWTTQESSSQLESAKIL